jgi:squalene-associated FAD-dependent desaturase
MQVPIAIVGGGWAGIACAVELADHGLPVVLFEAARQLGGRARRVDWNGLAIDNGQHLLIGAYRESLRLMTRLGTANALERRPLQLRMPGYRLSLPPWPKPLHLGIGLLVARGLSLRDKLAAARFMRHLRAAHFALPNDMPVDELLARHDQPTNLIDKLWAPLCLAALNTAPAIASARVFCNVLRDSLAGDRADSDLLFNRADLGRLLADAATALLLQRHGEIHPASKVGGLSRIAGGFQLHGPELSAERVVLATHPARLPALLTHLPELAEMAEPLSNYTWQPIHTLWLRFARPIRFPFPMLGLGDGQAPWAFERNDIAPGVVALVTSADGPHLHLSAERLRDDYLTLLAGQLGALPELLDWKAIIEKRATYSCVVDQYRPDNRTPLAGLYLAGDFTAGDYPATLEGAVRSGVECARHIIAEPK